jgi:hypothetical protein
MRRMSTMPPKTVPPKQLPTRFVIKRWPTNDDELFWFCQAVWGITIPRTQVCPNHVAPFTAFADAFFARHPVAVWYASRGFGGKTNLLSCLVNTEAVCLSADSSILGGSAAQSLNVHASSTGMWHHPMAPRYLLVDDPTKFDTHLTNGANIRSLMASQTSVRGPHPQRLRLDEIDEMEMDILIAAQGQPMRKRKNGVWIDTQTVMSSTWQYAAGTMTQTMERAKDVGWPIYSWCWKESCNPTDGWLSPKEVERKRTEIPKAMWEAEYDLQEPSFEGRAIDPTAIEATFDIRQTTSDLKWSIMQHPELGYTPAKGDRYVTGVDWAKQKDMTVITTFDTYGDVWYCVEIQVFNKMPWPYTVRQAEEQYKRWPGYFVHDSTGLGNVVADYFDPTLRRYHKFKDFVMSAGRQRMDLFSEYINAIESGMINYPRLEYVYKEHKFVVHDDLYGRGHPPDSVVAGALAWWGRSLQGKGMLTGPISFDRQGNPWDTSAPVS